MPLLWSDGFSAIFTFAAARSYVVVAVFMLLSGGMLAVRGWAAIKPAWADLCATGEPPVTSGPISNDWSHARLFAGPKLLVINVIVGLCACLLTTNGAAPGPSKSTIRFLHRQLEVRTVALAVALRTNLFCTVASSKSLCRSFCCLLGSCVLAIVTKAAKLQ
jgi:hypothetical protein